MIRGRRNFKNKKYTMLKDFDILAMPSQNQKQLYEEAVFEKGIQMMTPTYVRDEEGRKFSLWVSIEEFKQYGPGIYLLFLFLKYATIFTLIISLFSIIPLGLLIADGPLQSLDSNFQLLMARTTLGNAQGDELTVIMAFDFILSIIIFGAIIFWKQKQACHVVECCKEIMLPSYQTIKLKQIPQLYTEYDMKVFLQQRFGEVTDIYTVRNFNNDLYHYKQITKIAKAFKQQMALVKLKPQRSSIKLAKLFLEYQNYYFKMQRQSTLSKYPKQFAFITFKSVKSREEMIKFYKNTFPGLKGDQRDEYLYKTDQLKVKRCRMQPDGIKWENLHLPNKKKFIRIFSQISLLILVLFISIIVIFILYVSQSSLSQYQYYGKSKQQIMNLHSIQALQSYCLGLSMTSFNSDADCDQFTSEYAKLTILFVALPLIVAFLKFLLTQIMKALVGIRRHPYEISKIESQIIIMFAFYFFASGILQFIVFLQIRFEDNSTFSFVNIMLPIQNALVGYLDIDSEKISMTTDYNREWYKIVSQKVILIAIVSFNVSSFGKIAYSFLRKFACNFYARKQQLQCRMNYWLQGQQMQIDFVYAVAATIICFLLLFGSSMPIIYPFTCISLFILFWSTKFIFINFCAKPMLYSHTINSLVVKILLIGVIIRCFVAPLYFGASTIHSDNGIRNLLRIPHYGFYIALMLAALIYLFYRQKIETLFERIKNYYRQTQRNQDPVNTRKKKMSLPSKLVLIDAPQKSQFVSYSMHQNPVYENILKTLYTINKEERVRATCVLNKQLQNLLEHDTAFAEAETKINTSPKIFTQVCKIIQQNFDKFQKRVGKEYSKSNNPYKFYLKQLKELDRASKVSQADPEIYAEIDSQGFMSNSLKHIDFSHLKENLELKQNFGYQHLKKLQSLKRKYKSKASLRDIVQRSNEESMSSKRNSIEDYIQEAPTSEVRLNYEGNAGIISNLGMNSTIGSPMLGYGSPSHLETISRLHRNSLPNYQQKIKDHYLLEDKFDSIKETQSMINSVIFSKKYLNQPPQKDTNTIDQPILKRASTDDFQKNLSKKRSTKITASNSYEQKQSKNTKIQKQKSPKGIKSKKDLIFKAYKRKKMMEQKIDSGFQPSQSSYLDQSRSN